MCFLLKSNIFLYFNVKIYEFFGDYVRGNIKENRPCDAGLLNGKISILLEHLTLAVWGKNVKAQSRKVLFPLRLCALAFYKIMSVLFYNDTSPVVNVRLDTVLNVTELGEELLRNRSWLLAKDIALACLDVVNT